MNILYLDWNCFGGQQMISAFEKLGHTVNRFSHKDFKLSASNDFMDAANEFCKDKSFDFCFSFNYYPLMSRFCHEI
ncbi:MAG: hypothetical protein K6F37_05225, partial [Lachnospiraceae bacterium]|nr:hypothetical protein [Lachnospiraceae bacterium]